jgi:hypothetical protein
MRRRVLLAQFHRLSARTDGDSPTARDAAARIVRVVAQIRDDRYGPIPPDALWMTPR